MMYACPCDIFTCYNGVLPRSRPEEHNFSYAHAVLEHGATAKCTPPFIPRSIARAAMEQ